MSAKQTDARAASLRRQANGISAVERVSGVGRGPAELLDVGAVAGLLDCSTRHVYRLADSGRMPRPVKLGQLVRWRRTELMAWLDTGCPAVRCAKRGP